MHIVALARKAALLLCSCTLLLISASASQAQSSRLGIDIAAPSISHKVAERPGLGGESQTITALISDTGSGVRNATVFHRADSNHVFSPTEMTAGSNDNWMASVPTDIADTVIQYYLVAEDVAGNRVQKGSPSSPLIYPLIAAEGTPATVEQRGVSTTAQSPAPTSQSPVADATVASAGSRSLPTWALIGLGVLAVGLLAGLSGGSDSSPPSCCTVTFSTPDPVNGN